MNIPWIKRLAATLVGATAGLLASASELIGQAPKGSEPATALKVKIASGYGVASMPGAKPPSKHDSRTTKHAHLPLAAGERMRFLRSFWHNLPAGTFEAPAKLTPRSCTWRDSRGIVAAAFLNFHNASVVDTYNGLAYYTPIKTTQRPWVDPTDGKVGCNWWGPSFGKRLLVDFLIHTYDPRQEFQVTSSSLGKDPGLKKVIRGLAAGDHHLLFAVEADATTSSGVSICATQPDLAWMFYSCELTPERAPSK